MKPITRKALLFCLLAASAAAVTWDRLRASPRVPAISSAVPRAASDVAQGESQGMRAGYQASPPGSQGLSEVQALRPRDDYQRPGTDAFPVISLYPPPSAHEPPTAVEPVRPSAPALPFTVIGKKFERGQWEVYLAKGEQSFIATVGQRLSDDYRVSAITPTQMTLVYVPLDEQQTLQIGAGFHE